MNNKWLVVFALALASMAVVVALGNSSGVDSADIANGSIQEEDFLCVDVPADGEAFTYDSASGGCEWVAGGGGGGVHPVDLTSDVTGDLPVGFGGTNASSAIGARISLDVDQAGTDNSTNVTLAGVPDYITIAGQVITRGVIVLNDSNVVNNTLQYSNGGTGFAVYTNGKMLVGQPDGTLASKVLVACDDFNYSRMQYDFTNTTWLCDEDTFGTADITDDSLLVVDLSLDDTPVDGEHLVYNSAGGNIVFEAAGAGGSVTWGRIEDEAAAPLLSLPLGWLSSSLSTRVFIAGQEHYFPFYTPSEIGVDAVAVEVTSADAGGLARVCLYAADIDFQPGALVVDSGSFSTASVAVVTTTFTEEVLPAGYYMWSLVTDGTVTFRAPRGHTNLYSAINPAISTSPFVQSILVAGETSDVAGGCDATATAPTSYTFSGVGFYMPLFMRISTP